MTRPQCPMCFRPEATDADWDAPPKEPPELCWGIGTNCEDRRDERITMMETVLRRFVGEDWEQVWCAFLAERGEKP